MEIEINLKHVSGRPTYFAERMLSNPFFKGTPNHKPLRGALVGRLPDKAHHIIDSDKAPKTVTFFTKQFHANKAKTKLIEDCEVFGTEKIVFDWSMSGNTRVLRIKIGGKKFAEARTYYGIVTYADQVLNLFAKAEGYGEVAEFLDVYDDSFSGRLLHFTHDRYKQNQKPAKKPASAPASEDEEHGDG